MDVLARILKNELPQAAPGERCDLCARPIETEHAHLVDMRDRRLICSCRPCYLVFQPKGAAGGRYKNVPERYLRLKRLTLSESGWDRFQIPVGLAFFFYNSAEQKTMAFYPGPAGAMESLLPLDAWSELTEVCTDLAGMQSDVEAFLARRERDGGEEYFIVPIDRCYELVGAIRSSWKGFDGGQEARERIDAFFAGLRARADEQAELEGTA